MSSRTDSAPRPGQRLDQLEDWSQGTRRCEGDDESCCTGTMLAAWQVCHNDAPALRTSGPPPLFSSRLPQGWMPQGWNPAASSFVLSSIRYQLQGSASLCSCDRRTGARCRHSMQPAVFAKCFQELRCDHPDTPCAPIVECAPACISKMRWRVLHQITFEHWLHPAAHAFTQSNCAITHVSQSCSNKARHEPAARTFQAGLRLTNSAKSSSTVAVRSLKHQKVHEEVMPIGGKLKLKGALSAPAFHRMRRNVQLPTPQSCTPAAVQEARPHIAPRSNYCQAFGSVHALDRHR